MLTYIFQKCDLVRYRFHHHISLTVKTSYNWLNEQYLLYSIIPVWQFNSEYRVPDRLGLLTGNVAYI